MNVPIGNIPPLIDLSNKVKLPSHFLLEDVIEYSNSMKENTYLKKFPLFIDMGRDSTYSMLPKLRQKPTIKYKNPKIFFNNTLVYDEEEEIFENEELVENYLSLFKNMSGISEDQVFFEFKKEKKKEMIKTEIFNNKQNFATETPTLIVNLQQEKEEEEENVLDEDDDNYVPPEDPRTKNKEEDYPEKWLPKKKSIFHKKHKEIAYFSEIPQIVIKQEVFYSDFLIPKPLILNKKNSGSTILDFYKKNQIYYHVYKNDLICRREGHLRNDVDKFSYYMCSKTEKKYKEMFFEGFYFLILFYYFFFLIIFIFFLIIFFIFIFLIIFFIFIFFNYFFHYFFFYFYFFYYFFILIFFIYFRN